MSSATTPQPTLIYPESDGQPMADNTRQFRWIVTLQGGFDRLFAERADVFVAGDLLWYPVEGHPEIRVAPDVLLAFGRPKGDRGSYQQWREADIAPQVVVEVLSPGNSFGEMLAKLRFYEQHGVEEFYMYDPDRGLLDGWRRDGAALVPISDWAAWVSPRTGVRFALEAGELVVTDASGRRFASYLELEAERAAAAAEANAERERANAERERANAERERAERLAAQLRALGIDPEGI